MRHILFIDDEKVTLNALIYNLRVSYDFDVTLVEDYRNIDKIVIEKFDVLILDVMMQLHETDFYFSDQERKLTCGGLRTGFVIYNKLRIKYPRLPIVIYSSTHTSVSLDDYTLVMYKPALASTFSNSINNFIDTVLNFDN